MDGDWSNAFGILMCREICNGAGAGIFDGAPSTRSNVILFLCVFSNISFAITSLGKERANLSAFSTCV